MSNWLDIEVFGTDGSYWPIYGRNAGRCPVRLGDAQVKGLFEAPVRTQWTASSMQVGGSMKGRWWDFRDISLGVHIIETDRPWAETYSEFRRAFDYREDDWDWDAQLAKIVVTSEQSGSRWLYVQLYEAPDFNPDRDPVRRKHGNPIIPLRAAQPFWEQDMATDQVMFTAPGTKNVVVRNDTNLPMMHKWVMTTGGYVLPDVSWEGAPGARRPGRDKMTGRDDRDRLIILPDITDTEGGATVDLDPMALNIRDFNDTNLVGRLPVPGRYFTYIIPPHTQPTELPVSCTKVGGGGASMVQLRMPRRWREPLGGERKVHTS